MGDGVVVKEQESFEGPGRREEVWTTAACAVEQPSLCTSVLGFGWSFLHLEWSQLWDEIFPLCREGEHGQGGTVMHVGLSHMVRLSWNPLSVTRGLQGGSCFSLGRWVTFRLLHVHL